MSSNRLGKFSQALLVVGLSVLGSTASLHADDTEIYQTEYDSTLTGRPKVLIAIDDSGSMATVIPNSKPAYDPAGVYTTTADTTRIYWSTDGKPPAANTTQYFVASKNRCASSYSSLTTQGFFQTKARRWRDATTAQQCVPSCPGTHPFLRTQNNKCYRNAQFTGQNVSPGQTCTDVVTPGSWDALNTSTPSPRHVECQVDVTNSNPANGSGQANGYPKTNVVDAQAYSAATPAASNVNWGSESYTFFSAHYMNYVYDSDTRDQTRMDIARNVITSLIEANTGIDFGLLEFNGNWSAAPAANGGRIVRRIITDMTDAQRTNVVDLVKAMDAGGSTPLCEATTEAYRYLAGKPVVYGLQPDTASGRGGDTIPRDLLAESALTYRSPATDCAYTYVVLMTDGLPQNDTNANTAVETLTGKTCASYATDGQGTTKNCLVEITRYMANTDLDNDTTNGNQYGITYTIGFTTDQVLLRDAATAGKGQYFTADNAEELTAAFQGAILSILSTDTTFTSPAVAVDSFSRTESRDDVFYAMFKPADRIDWRGNIKKLKLKIAGGSASLVDANGAAAIDPVTGFIKDTATTFWSTTADGPNVEAGGVGGLLAARSPSSRVIKTNTGTAGALLDFNSTNLNYTAFGLADAAQLFTFFGVPNQAGLDTLISWARGTDVYDEDGDANITENRPWVLADILHSQPLVVNYGALPGFSKDNPDLRLVVGTNGGFVHMFGNDDGQEDWAFFPKELAPILRQRALNPVSSQHVYGVDNTPVLYTKDENRDGTITASDGDKAYLYLTLRRGGEAIYALDISIPGTPKFLWKIDADQSGFGELGQTWSRPVVTKIPGYKENDKSKPVLIFAAGYDINKDASGVATPDAVGRGLFVVDAATGALVWKVTPAADSATNMQETGLLHSVASPVTPLDSNGDEVTDRVYFGDTGGNLWRVDMPGPNLPDAQQNDFRIVKMAAMNGGTSATDRRFFNAPDVVRTSYQGDSFDAVALGSGDRNNPNATDNDDQFYMIRDEQVLPYFTEFVRSTACDTDEDTKDDFRCLLPFTVDKLYDVTANTIQTGSEEASAAAVVALGNANGWRMDLNASGEKSLAKSLTIGGKIYFTTFSPEVDDTSLCVPSPGTGRLYIVSLTDATAIRDFDGDDDFDRALEIPSLIPETVSPTFGPDGKVRLLPPPGTIFPEPEEPCGGVGIECTGDTLREPYGSFWYQEEY